MKKILCISLFLFSLFTYAQVDDWNRYVDTLSVSRNEDGEEEIEFLMQEMLINFSKEEMERIRTMEVLKRRIMRVQPYAVATSDNLTIMNRNLARMETKKQRNAYIKRSEDYLNKNFKERLKKLSRKDGQILVKLIHRQTGESTFDLLKEFKSGWSAFWSNQTAKMFDINLKTTYNPQETLEDFYIEILLDELHRKGRIDNRKAAIPINYPKMYDEWKSKLGDSGLYPDTE